MFKKTYNIAIDSNNSTEAFNTLLDVFNHYGTVVNATENPIEDVKTKEEVYKVIIIEVKARKSRFEKLLKIMRKAGHPLHYIKGYWFM